MKTLVLVLVLIAIGCRVVALRLRQRRLRQNAEALLRQLRNGTGKDSNLTPTV